MPNTALIETHRPPHRILAAGRNCWQRVRATRAALLTNADYFSRLADCLKRARRRVLLVGWDLDAGLVLAPHSTGPEAQPLRDFLDVQLGERPELTVRFLLWDRTVFYGGNRRSAAALTDLEARHPGFRHHFLSAPFLCSHHAKLLAVDGSLAFIGGIDLAGDRWDPADHPPSHPDRMTPDGESYGPTHDLQMMVTGPAATSLAAYAAARWTEATGEPMPKSGLDAAAWPADLTPDFADIPAGIARTEPGGPIREVAALNDDVLAGARHCIYLEAQYLTAGAVGDRLVDRLSEPDGPEIVIIVTRTSHGYLEQFAMGNNRDRLLRRLQAADRWGRLRVYYPTVPDGAGRVEVKIHAKLVVIDDRLLRVGSSNLNNRSMAVDTECDLALEAADAAQRAQIRAVRDRLIADQLHRPVSVVTAALQRNSSLIAAIDALNGAGHLQPLQVPQEDLPSVPMPGTSVLDPREPPTLERLWSELGLGGSEVVPEFGAGKQQTADGKRD